MHEAGLVIVTNRPAPVQVDPPLRRVPVFQMTSDRRQRRGLLYIFHVIEIVEIAQPATAHQPDPLFGPSSNHMQRSA